MFIIGLAFLVVVFMADADEKAFFVPTGGALIYEKVSKPEPGQKSRWKERFTDCKHILQKGENNSIPILIDYYEILRRAGNYPARTPAAPLDSPIGSIPIQPR